MRIPEVRARWTPTSNSFEQDDKYRRYSKIMDSPYYSPRIGRRRWIFSTDNFTCSNCIHFLFFGTFLLTFLSFIFITFQFVESEDLELTTEETRLISPNTYIYNYIEMLDKSSKVNTFFYEEYPPLTKTVQVELNETVELKKRNFKYWARFLNEGSKVQISWKSSSQVSFYIIRGSQSFKDWIQAPKNKYLTHDSASSSKRLFTAETAEDYYFVMENDGDSLRVTATATFDIIATCFDTSKAKGFYAGSFRMDFPLGSKQYLVLSNPSQIHSLLVSLSFSSRFHFTLFVALLVEVLITCGCLFWKLSSNRDESENQTSQSALEGGFKLHD